MSLVCRREVGESSQACFVLCLGSVRTLQGACVGCLWVRSKQVLFAGHFSVKAIHRLAPLAQTCPGVKYCFPRVRPSFAAGSEDM